MTLLTITSSKHVTPVFFCEKLVPKDQRSMFKRNFTNLKFTNAQNGQCKCHKMLLLHLSCFIVLSCLSSQCLLQLYPLLYKVSDRKENDKKLMCS